MSHNPIIIALDVETAAQARQLVRQIGDATNFYKVGMELYAAGGMEFVRELTLEGKQVFLDLKFYDIGETVKRAVTRVAESGVTFLTVHASKGVMRAAVAGRGDSSLKLLAVTVLTSVDQQDLEDDGYRNVTVRELVHLRVRNAVAAGIDGIVCSALEVPVVRQISTPGTILVTPGVRSPGADHGDQKRVATPAQAILDGSNYLVIGRQVTRAADPRAAVASILEEVAIVS